MQGLRGTGSYRPLEGATVDEAEAHHEAMGPTVTIHDVFGEFVHEFPAAD